MVSEGKHMRLPGFMIAVLLLAPSAPSTAQVLKPQLTQAPCTDPHNCPNYKRGAALDPPGSAAGQKVPCPTGTVYNPKRGTCKVVGSH
jgi:hypothetical protein